MPVYFVRAGDTDRVKIGYAKNVAARLVLVQTGCVEPLVLLRVIDGGPKAEAALHQHFAAYRIRGEWFRFCDGMLTVDAPHVVERQQLARTPEWQALEQAKDIVGGAAALGRALGLTRSAISQWRSVPAERVPEVMRLTGIRMSVLCPRVFSPAGKWREEDPPVIDVAAVRKSLRAPSPAPA